MRSVFIIFLFYVAGVLLGMGVLHDFYRSTQDVPVGGSASLWFISSDNVRPVSENWGLSIPGLAPASTECLQITSAGVFQASGDGCGGTGGGDPFAWTVEDDGVSTSTRLIFGNGFISQASSTMSGTSTLATTTVTGQIRAPDGSQSVPAYSFADEPDTGFYRGDDVINLSIGGNLKYIFGGPANNFFGLHITGDDETFVQSGRGLDRLAYTWTIDDDTGITRLGANEIGIITGATERLRIDDSGNIGIGTTSPYAKLSVSGEAVASHFTGTTTATSTLFGNLIVASSSDTGRVKIGNFATIESRINPDSEESVSLTSPQSVDIQLGGNGFFNVYDPNGDYVFFVDTGGDLTITGNSIFASDQDAKLFFGDVTGSKIFNFQNKTGTVALLDNETFTGTTTVANLDITGAIDAMGEYFENFTTYIRSLFTGGDGITITDGDIDCDTADGSTFGCLTASDWSKFDNKISSTTIDTESELESFLTDVTNVFTNNDTIDISDNTNLTAGRSLTLTDDSVGADDETYAVDFTFAVSASSSIGTADNLLSHTLSKAWTVQEVRCYTRTGTTTIQHDETSAADPNGAGTDVFSLTLDCGSKPVAATTTFSNASIAANAPFNLDIDSVTGTATDLRVTVFGNYDD